MWAVPPAIISGLGGKAGAHSAAVVCLGTGSQPALLRRTPKNTRFITQGGERRPSKDALDPPARGNRHLTCRQREGSEAQSFLLKDPEYLRQERSQAGYWRPARAYSSTSESKARAGPAPLLKYPFPGYQGSSPSPGTPRLPAGSPHPSCLHTLCSQQTRSPAPSEELGVCGGAGLEKIILATTTKRKGGERRTNRALNGPVGEKCVQAWTHLGVFFTQNPWPNALKSEPDLNSSSKQPLGHRDVPTPHPNASSSFAAPNPAVRAAAMGNVYLQPTGKYGKGFGGFFP